MHNSPVPLDKTVFDREVKYAFKSALRARDNESAWNYLRGLMLPLVQKAADGTPVVGGKPGQYIATDEDRTDFLEKYADNSLLLMS